MFQYSKGNAQLAETASEAPVAGKQASTDHEVPVLTAHYSFI